MIKRPVENTAQHGTNANLENSLDMDVESENECALDVPNRRPSRAHDCWDSQRTKSATANWKSIVREHYALKMIYVNDGEKLYELKDMSLWEFTQTNRRSLYCIDAHILSFKFFTIPR